MNNRDVRREILLCVSTVHWKHGAQIREEIQEKVDEEIHQPQIYNALVKLEAGGFLESKLQNEGTPRQRRLYRKKVGGKKARWRPSFPRWFGVRPKEV